MIVPNKNAPSAKEYPASAATTAMPNNNAASPNVCSSSSAETLIRFNNHGTSNRPKIPVSTTNAPSCNNVVPSFAPPPSPICIIEFSNVSITTATTSSSTEIPMANCPERS